jgi:hypothetical protein
MRNDRGEFSCIYCEILGKNAPPTSPTVERNAIKILFDHSPPFEKQK